VGAQLPDRRRPGHRHGRDGLVNGGQLVHERHAADGVALVGFASHRESVLAAGASGTSESVLPVPNALADIHEDFLHRALGRPAVLVRPRPGWPVTLRLVGPPGDRRGPTADPVVKELPANAHGGRYDTLIWFEQTEALRPIHHEPPPSRTQTLGSGLDVRLLGLLLISVT
jgi:erythromycin esterase